MQLKGAPLMKVSSQNRPLTAGKIADYCSVSHQAVLRWVKSNKLKTYRTPGKHIRIEVKDFLDFLKKYGMPVPIELSGNTQKKRILIVDDNRTVQSLYQLLVKDNMYDVAVAQDGFIAGQKFCEFKPDLIILDIRISGLDGYELCSRIRNNLNDKDVKIIAISGEVGQEGFDRILKIGADDFLLKPFDNEALVLKIEKLLELKKEKTEENHQR